MTFFLTACFAFAVGAIYDALNVGFMHASEKGRPVRAGIFSVLVGLAAFVGFREAIENIWMLPFLLGGYFVGTYWAVGMKGKKPKSAREVLAAHGWPAEDPRKEPFVSIVNCHGQPLCMECLTCQETYPHRVWTHKYEEYLQGKISYADLDMWRPS